MFSKRYTQGKWNLSLEDADEEQIQLANELKDIGKGNVTVEKSPFLRNAVLFISARQKILNNFKGKIFPTRNPEPAPKPESTVFATPKSTARQKILNNFKGKIFPTRNPEPAPKPEPTAFATPKSTARQKILNNFKGKIFPTRNPEPAPKPKPTVFATPKSTNERAKKISIQIV